MYTFCTLSNRQKRPSRVIPKTWRSTGSFGQVLTWNGKIFIAEIFKHFDNRKDWKQELENWKWRSHETSRDRLIREVRAVNWCRDITDLKRFWEDDDVDFNCTKDSVDLDQFCWWPGFTAHLLDFTHLGQHLPPTRTNLACPQKSSCGHWAS